MRSTSPRQTKPRPDDTWRQSAACRGMDTNLWFPDDAHTRRQALRICYGCTVAKPCLEDFMDSTEPTHRRTVVRGGVWWDADARPRMDVS